MKEICRIFNPDAMQFTRRRGKGEIQCRLDFCLISDTLCLEAEIMPGYRTDLSMITVRITTTNPRGPGLWKLNTHLLPETA